MIFFTVNHTQEEDKEHKRGKFFHEMLEKIFKIAKYLS